MPFGNDESVMWCYRVDVVSSIGEFIFKQDVRFARLAKDTTIFPLLLTLSDGTKVRVVSVPFHSVA